MKEYIVDGRTYRLSGGLTDFQLNLYMHLVDWKRAHLTEECGFFNHKGRRIPYDSMFPDELKNEMHPLYRPILGRVREHQRRFPFKLHKFVGHMASSQMACINLFVPLLQHPKVAAKALSSVNAEIASIATDHLDQGFQIEYWPGTGTERGPLNDHSHVAGTDSDIAIAYRDHQGRLKLWLIEHKLTEQEFTTCGGAVSKGRTDSHRCEPAADIAGNHDLCYYHGANGCGYTYWDTTDRHPEVFPLDQLAAGAQCPFRGGMNQLWRNMALALAVEDDPDEPYERVHFSVVHHPDNHALEPTIGEFRVLTNYNVRFDSFTSRQLIEAIESTGVDELSDWTAWYKGLYAL